MKHLKKLIIKYRKQLFCILTFCSLISFTFTCVSAYDSPLDENPTTPNYINPDYIESSEDGQLLYNTDMVSQFLLADETYYEVRTPLNFESADITINTQPHWGGENFRAVIRSYTVYVRDIPYNHNTVQFRGVLDNIPEFNWSHIDLTDFTYIPYTSLENAGGSNDRRIFMFRCAQAMVNALGNEIFQVQGSFSFIGNNNVYEFSIPYTCAQQQTGFNVTYEALLEECGLVDNNVPIYIHNLTVILPDSYTEALFANTSYWIGIYTPHATTFEYEGYYLNSENLYTNTYHFLMNYFEDMELNLEWIIDGVNGFMNSQLFYGVTFGGIALLAITSTLAIFVLRVLSHLK